MKKNLLFIIAGVLAISITKAQTKDPDTTARHFLIMASIGNLQEINAGELAVQKATIPEVKAFGQKMIKDHSDAQTKLLQLAKMKGYQLPLEATEKPPMDMMLTKANGKEFDRAYIHMMVPGHKNTAYMFEDYGLTGKDPDVRSYAQQTLPVIKGHLETIKAIDDQYKNLVAK